MPRSKLIIVGLHGTSTQLIDPVTLTQMEPSSEFSKLVKYNNKSDIMSFLNLKQHVIIQLICHVIVQVTFLAAIHYIFMRSSLKGLTLKRTKLVFPFLTRDLGQQSLCPV